MPIASRSFPNQQFFQSMQVDPGAHTLTINVTTTVNPYILDYLFFCGQTQGKPNNEKDAQLEAIASSRRIAEIIGGVLGATVFILLLVLACLLWNRRRRRDRSKRSAISPIREWLQRRKWKILQYMQSLKLTLTLKRLSSHLLNLSCETILDIQTHLVSELGFSPRARFLYLSRDLSVFPSPRSSLRDHLRCSLFLSEITLRITFSVLVTFLNASRFMMVFSCSTAISQPSN